VSRQDTLGILRRWACLNTLPRSNWTPVRKLIRTAEQYAILQSRDIERLLHESERMLARFPDPLNVDLGLHRWLASEREESYSDWLAWVLQELTQVPLLLELLGLVDPELVATLRDCSLQVEREKWVTVDGVWFRLDIVVRFIRSGCDQANLIVEVKKGSAETADTDKQKYYAIWHNAAAGTKKIDPSAFLVVTDANETQYQGFHVLRWEDICLRLRRMLPAIDQTRGIVKAAMVLAFVSAVEQNLLHLILRNGFGDAPFADALVAEHLRRALHGDGG